ncbi:MAG: carbohydrate binding family 9 domain-containing protein, partial [Bacteroidota bacterium]
MRLFLFLCLLGTFPLFGQDDENFPPPEAQQQIQAIKASSKITIDGKLDEIDWQQGEVISEFFRREPRQGGSIRYATQVRLLYDDKNLYIGATCKDSVGLKGIRVQDLRRDFSWGENDIFGIALDPQNLKQYAQGFQTTPYGNQRDFQNFNGNSFDTGWNTLWRVRTKRSDQGYTVEMAIPFKSLRYNLPEEGNTITLGFTLVRYARRDIEVSSFPAIPQSFTPYRMTYAAQLTGIEAPPPSTNIRVEPYALYQYDENKSGEALIDKLNEPKVGFDAKWAINPKTVLDL